METTQKGLDQMKIVNQRPELMNQGRLQNAETPFDNVEAQTLGFLQGSPPSTQFLPEQGQGREV